MRIRWLFLLAAVAFLFWNIFFSVSAWSLGGFLACGAAWYALAWRKRHALDAPRPR